MSDADAAPDSMPLIPPGLVPRAVLGFHVVFAIGLLGIAALAFGQGRIAQVAILLALSLMVTVAGVAAGRLVARQ
jgi:hypothetical protein